MESGHRCAIAGNLARISKRPKAWLNLPWVDTDPVVTFEVTAPQVTGAASMRAVMRSVPFETDTLSGSSM